MLRVPAWSALLRQPDRTHRGIPIRGPHEAGGPTFLRRVLLFFLAFGGSVRVRMMVAAGTEQCIAVVKRKMWKARLVEVGLSPERECQPHRHSPKYVQGTAQQGSGQKS